MKVKRDKALNRRNTAPYHTFYFSGEGLFATRFLKISSSTKGDLSTVFFNFFILILINK